MQWESRDHALFAAYAPTDKPRYAVIVVVEHGGSGSAAAAPVGAKILKEALNLQDKPVKMKTGGVSMSKLIIAGGRKMEGEIEVQGAMKIKKACPDAVLIFNLPPSIEELRNRLVKRNTDAEDVIEKRVAAAEWEIEQAKNYDYVIVNDVVEKAADTFLAIVKAEQCAIGRNKNLLALYK